MCAQGLRCCGLDELTRMLEIINLAAQRYHGAIPDECWHEPYMDAAALAREIAAGVKFWGVEDGRELLGIMGVQAVKNVELIRHAYVLPRAQGRGIGSDLLSHFIDGASKPMLVGTWAAASWAINFYERRGFTIVPPSETPPLLRRYWSIPDRQIEASVVLRSRSSAS